MTSLAAKNKEEWPSEARPERLRAAQ